MILLFMPLIRTVPMSQLNTAARCRSLAVGDAVPQEPDARAHCDDRGGGDAVNEVTSVSPPCPHASEGGRQPTSAQRRWQKIGKS